ncbi:hypothetical protein RHGRI_011373 [Rhododendron griersonianum]|uniref:Uncharacterized protein n=1 Tax=Rhododendron griersonianum TaxID=479676 RepID=A0AAV6KMC6_9ERIC|nr:hypothetical protein RHGRI_011373 [Rhododendron griersonianum]
MAAAPARARADYDQLVKLLLIGDSGNSFFSFLSYSLPRYSLTSRYGLVLFTHGLERVACCCAFQMIHLQQVLLPQSGAYLTIFDYVSYIHNRLTLPEYRCFVRIDFKIRTIELDGKRIKLQIWDTAGQERFRTITTAYYRGAMGILLVYDVTDESSFNNIRNWIRNIEQHASDNVNKILVGNKADMDESKTAVPTSRGQALADEYGIKFFETSAKTNLNVEQVFFSIARDIRQRLAESDTKAEAPTIKISKPEPGKASTTLEKSACCGT